MKNLRFTKIICAMSLIICHCARFGSAAENGPATDHAASLAPLLSDDTFAVAYFDIKTATAPQSDDPNNLAAMVPHAAENAKAILAVLRGVAPSLAKFREAGADSVYFAVGLLDIHAGGGPVAVVYVNDAAKVEQVAGLLRGLTGSISMAGASWIPKFEVRPLKHNTLLVGSSATVERYAAADSAGRNDLTEPLARLAGDGAAIAAVFSPGPDFRRVVRELWPALPAPLAQQGTQIADRWQRVEFAIHPNVKPIAQLILETSDETSADMFARMWRDVPKVSDSHEQRLRAFVDALPPRVEGSRVVIKFPTEEAKQADLMETVAELVGTARQKAARGRRMSQFKQLALAFHNFADTYKGLPPAAIHHKNGQPLLSWRVAILPFIDENELYKQFHLDEPWDSPHNRELIKKMPDLYADDDPNLRQLAREGKTAFQLPVGPDTIFHDNDGTMFREITDGTSNTIMIVEVESSRAAIWTKPADWEVDLENPREGIERSDRNFFSTAFADGSARTFPTDIDAAKLRAHLTRAGKEPIDW